MNIDLDEVEQEDEVHGEFVVEAVGLGVVRPLSSITICLFYFGFFRLIRS